MKGSGPKDERETIVSFNETDAPANLWTASEVTYRRMVKRGWQPVEDSERHAVFEFPVKQLRLPRQKSKRGFQGKPKEVPVDPVQ